MTQPSHPAPSRRRYLAAALPLLLTMLLSSLSRRAEAVRASGDRGEANTASIVLWIAIAALLAATAGPPLVDFVTTTIASLTGG